ncbi:hypothetical protein [Falsiroseomonas bella]|uniref:hypothetical protein n=1 Tax=Falsiroseomonas bella TaxID=2184016 RepID=UPI001304BE11|nr:hypothetical protein [Falsiroseomonas bella]
MNATDRERQTGTHLLAPLSRVRQIAVALIAFGAGYATTPSSTFAKTGQNSGLSSVGRRCRRGWRR